jgi:hypothetical protein
MMKDRRLTHVAPSPAPRPAASFAGAGAQGRGMASLRHSVSPHAVTRTLAYPVVRPASLPAHQASLPGVPFAARGGGPSPYVVTPPPQRYQDITPGGGGCGCGCGCSDVPRTTLGLPGPVPGPRDELGRSVLRPLRPPIPFPFPLGTPELDGPPLPGHLGVDPTCHAGRGPAVCDGCSGRCVGIQFGPAFLDSAGQSRVPVVFECVSSGREGLLRLMRACLCAAYSDPHGDNGVCNLQANAWNDYVARGGSEAALLVDQATLFPPDQFFRCGPEDPEEADRQRRLGLCSLGIGYLRG